MSRCRTLPFHPLRDGDDGGDDRVRHGRDHARHDDAHRVHAHHVPPLPHGACGVHLPHCNRMNLIPESSRQTYLHLQNQIC